MKLKIEINDLKPIGLNNSYIIVSRGKFAGRTKKKETREYEKNISDILVKYSKEIKEFNSIYDPEKHYIDVSYRFHIPILKKNKKSINMKSGDVDGLVKIVQDSIFKELSCDDSAICSLSACKIHSETYKILADITICDIKHIL